MGSLRALKHVDARHSPKVILVLGEGCNAADACFRVRPVGLPSDLLRGSLYDIFEFSHRIYHSIRLISTNIFTVVIAVAGANNLESGGSRGANIIA